jgi:Rrf2 family protein
MLKFSKKVEYGLMALVHMDSVRNGELVTSREISERYDIPAELLGKVLQALARAALIRSAPGVHGGYRLLKTIDRITLGQVVEAVEGPVRLATCQADPANCGQYENCNIKQPVMRVQRQLQDYMYGLSLAAFRGAVRAGGVVLDVAR